MRYYPHRSRDLLSHVCRIFLRCIFDNPQDLDEPWDSGGTIDEDNLHKICRFKGCRHSMHPPLETRGLYKPFYFRFCACCGVINTAIKWVQKLGTVH